MNDHQMSRSPARRKLKQCSQREPDLLTICYNRLISLADLPTGEGQNQVHAPKLRKHRSYSARNAPRRGVVKEVSIEALREFQIVRPRAFSTRNLLADVCGDNS